MEQSRTNLQVLQENYSARLQSFANCGWPSNSPVDVRALARTGFFATGIGLETQCSWCLEKISNWRPGDNIAARHRRLEPDCPFQRLSTMSSCESISRHSSGSDDTTNGPFPDYQRESDRLATFNNWPNPNVSAESLAKAGFYYLNDSDKVKCAWCQGIVAEWEAGDNAFDEHKRLFPTCSLILHGPNFPIEYTRDNGIQEYKAPKKPMYASLNGRLETYKYWPRSDIQKPEILAEAGFYYQNTDDQVRCFHCNGGLRSWRKEDVPWFEHAKWFPHCHYVQLAKGQPYIDEVLDQIKRQWLRENCDQTGQECFEQSPPPPQPAMTLDDAMCSEPVRLALQMGLNVGRIKSATKRRLDTLGQPYNTAEELVEAVLEGQTDEESYEDDEVNQSVIREVTRFFDNILNPTRLVKNSSSPVATSSTSATSTITTSNSSSTESNSTMPSRKGPTVVRDQQKFSTTPPRVDGGSSSGNSSDNVKTDEANDAMVEFMKQMSLEEENRQLKDARTCKICMDDECGVVFLPCGHLVACVLCAPGINLCPICRTPIKGFVRTYLS